MDIMTITISVEELDARIRKGQKQTILAAMWDKPGATGKEQFCSEHISTALFCDVGFALAGVPGSSIGRNPLPSKEILDHWISSWGLSPDKQVVVYDNHHGLFAARAWWILKWAGFDNVVILDGGQAEWERKGFNVLGGPGNLAGYSEEFKANLGQMPTATIEEVKAHKGILIDAREANRFAGRKEYLDLKAGHIPGAINIPTRSILDENDCFKSKEELTELFAAHGITPETKDMIIYSGSGNHSAQVIAAMALVGLEIPRHYIGGWSQWCADATNEVETGGA
jgi:thiosulfate/3-mercaptopyruvate sulfurtransferase